MTKQCGNETMSPSVQKRTKLERELTDVELNAVAGGSDKGRPALNTKGSFEVTDYSFDVEQTLSIGSQSSGAGAGKVTFNPF